MNKMKLDIKIYKGKFKTAGKTNEEIMSEYDESIGPLPTNEELELWKKTLIAIDGAEVYITDSIFGTEDRMALVGWPQKSDSAIKEFVYAAEQDPMFGKYQDEREQFNRDWVADEYEPVASLTVSASDIEIIEQLGEFNG